MNATHHIKQRMAQRGISKAMVDLALEQGRIEGDKHVIDRKEALKRLRELDAERRVLTKILDKGGIAVVSEGESLITTYNRNSQNNWQ
ncbi:DUF4258 domain-containing protein [Paucibacter sp. B2R-40]|uniref:DUF4258 domain-containing protein n=1 Tax=Paucibacter sp. B2R-40 TaxID=2893554 RepID=UPI0021E383EC|nr:DUF4258 domain-containing protein [Paucibacter sp. B2R-40]MCV2352641.1 DUF4258 domain-containing protein [Paucibacter sp. B2R-40]